MNISNNFELNIEREPRDIISKYSNSVLLMETLKDGDVSCGTCFLIERDYLITCRHNIEGRKFSVFFDEDTKIDDSFFNVEFHPKRDIAILSFKAERLVAISKDLQHL